MEAAQRNSSSAGRPPRPIRRIRWIGQMRSGGSRSRKTSFPPPQIPPCISALYRANQNATGTTDSEHEKSSRS
jgi:hypothetical protein